MTQVGRTYERKFLLAQSLTPSLAGGERVAQSPYYPTLGERGAEMIDTQVEGGQLGGGGGPQGQRSGARVLARIRGQEVWGQEAEMGVLLRVRGQGVGRLFSGVRGQDLGAALSLRHSPCPQAL